MRQERQAAPVRRVPHTGQASNSASGERSDMGRLSCRITGPVVAGCLAVYSSAMNEPAEAQAFRVVERSGPGGRLVLRRQSRDTVQWLVISGFQGPELPAQVTEPAIEPAPGAAGGWHLSCAEGEFDFRARAVDRLAAQPALFAPLHRPFALTGADRLAVRILLWLLRLPGGARLLRHWHARRG
jgi:hypothetical protein